jgi:hypothetical protein
VGSTLKGEQHRAGRTAIKPNNDLEQSESSVHVANPTKVTRGLVQQLVRLVRRGLNPKRVTVVSAGNAKIVVEAFSSRGAGWDAWQSAVCRVLKSLGDDCIGVSDSRWIDPGTTWCVETARDIRVMLAHEFTESRPSLIFIRGMSETQNSQRVVECHSSRFGRASTPARSDANREGSTTPVSSRAECIDN